ncbi:unnamed protein product [Danaus chrysippus]|uniref:(African queen) hypothetical protein n=1 Tax=Danaus chrysippus TaxID=151541 RepID=A0A8J2QSI3_9NEOP|nr:unnamed protein product [Danaus chrysippus]
MKPKYSLFLKGDYKPAPLSVEPSIYNERMKQKENDGFPKLLRKVSVLVKKVPGAQTRDGGSTSVSDDVEAVWERGMANSGRRQRLVIKLIAARQRTRLRRRALRVI